LLRALQGTVHAGVGSTRKLTRRGLPVVSLLWCVLYMECFSRLYWVFLELSGADVSATTETAELATTGEVSVEEKNAMEKSMLQP
jgi:hypothetical protein